MIVFEEYCGVLFEVLNESRCSEPKWKYKIIPYKPIIFDIDNLETYQFEGDRKEKIYASYNGEDYVSVSEYELIAKGLYTGEDDISDDFFILDEYAGGIIFFQKRDDYKYKHNILAVTFDDKYTDFDNYFDELFVKWACKWSDMKEIKKNKFIPQSSEKKKVHFLRYCYRKNLFENSYLNSIIKREDLFTAYFKDLSSEQLKFSDTITGLTNWGFLLCFLNIYKYSHRLFQNDIIILYFTEKGKEKIKIDLSEIVYNKINWDIRSFQTSIPNLNRSRNILRGNPLPYCDIRHDSKELADCFTETAFNNHFNDKWEITAYVASEFEYFVNYELENIFSYLRYCLSLNVDNYQVIKDRYEYRRLHPKDKPEQEVYTQRDLRRLAQSGLDDMNQADPDWHWNID